MNKIIKIFLTTALILVGVNTVKASEITLTYSDWSQLYPAGIPDVFIEEENRYYWFKETNGKIEYVEEFLTNLDGYEKDENTETKFYRYITNPTLVFNGKNEMILNPTLYCAKRFCYYVNRGEPEMLDLSGKFEFEYNPDDMYVSAGSENPMTGDNAVIYISAFVGSLVLALVCLFVKKKSKA